MRNKNKESQEPNSKKANPSYGTSFRRNCPCRWAEGQIPPFGKEQYAAAYKWCSKELKGRASMEQPHA